MSEEHPHLRLVHSKAPSGLSDGDLLAQCAEGNEEAAKAFVHRHQASLMRFLSRMLGAHDADLQDIAQGVLLAALQSAHRYDGRAQARTWLLGIAHNKVKMEIRSRTRRRRAMSLLAKLRLVEPASRPPEADGLQDANRIQAAVLTLEPNHRSAFVLCEVEGHTSREAAEILSVPEGTVSRWRSQARSSLRPLLADLLPSGGES
jgi:RNA polymerase sigma-70 factor (ECF subfamily)